MPIREHGDLRRENRKSRKAEAKRYHDTMTEFSQSKKDVAEADTIDSKLPAYAAGVRSSLAAINELGQFYLTTNYERSQQFAEIEASRDQLGPIAEGSPSVPYLVPRHSEWARNVLETVEGRNRETFSAFEEQIRTLLTHASEAAESFGTVYEREVPHLSKLKLSPDDSAGLKRATRTVESRFDLTIGELKKLTKRAQDAYFAVYSKSNFDWDLAHKLMTYVIDEESRREDFEGDRDAENTYEGKINDVRTRVNEENHRFLQAWSAAKETIDAHATRSASIVDDEELGAIITGNASTTTNAHREQASALIEDAHVTTDRIRRAYEHVTTDMFTKTLDAYDEVLMLLAHQEALLDDTRVSGGVRGRHTDSTPRKAALVALARIRSSQWRASYHARFGASPLDGRRLDRLEARRSALTDEDTRRENHEPNEDANIPEGAKLVKST